MPSPKKETFYSLEYENSSHVAHKKKAAENKFRKKNVRDIIELIGDEDSEEDYEKYVRYIK